jgi:hypothetical protein
MHHQPQMNSGNSTMVMAMCHEKYNPMDCSYHEREDKTRKPSATRTSGITIIIKTNEQRQLNSTSITISQHYH